MWFNISARDGLSTDRFSNCWRGSRGSQKRAGSNLFLALRVDRLAPLEHRDKGLDLLLPASFGFHIVGAKGQREAVLCALSFASIALALGAASIAAWRSSGIFMSLPLS